MLLGTAALLAQLLVVVGCSSSDSNNTGSGGTPVMTGTGGAAGTGGSTGSGGANSDANCTSTNAKTGMSCTVDCMIPCGFQALGTKVCTCIGGVYSACPCPAPAGWQGAATAPYCDTPDGTGLTTAIKNTACMTEFQECIGKDQVTGTTPQGCACLNNPTTNSLQWYCGSTNRWFSLSM
jgi:hypothetical protein